MKNKRFDFLEGIISARCRRRQKTSVPGYARLHNNITKVGSRLRSVTQKGNQGRLPVTLGHTKT